MNWLSRNISKLLFVLSGTLCIFGTVDAQKRNPYNLDIISSYERYFETISEDADNELVDLEKIIPSIIMDIRYATDNNFTGTKIYEAPKAYLRRPVAEALLKVQQDLESEGLGLKVFDAYRPYEATVYFYEVYHDSTFVASPRTGSVHNKGCAVDVTLICLKTGEELEMPTPFDDFTEKAAINYMKLPDNALKNRDKLISIMSRHGFETYSAEWWHFNYHDRKKYKILNLSFYELEIL